MKLVSTPITFLKHSFAWILLMWAVFVTSCCDFSSHLAGAVCRPAMGWSALLSTSFAAGGRG